MQYYNPSSSIAIEVKLSYNYKTVLTFMGTSTSSQSGGDGYKSGSVPRSLEPPGDFGSPDIVNPM